MKLWDRVKLGYQVATKKDLGNSIGSVVRNYGKQSKFDPQRQVTGITFKAIDKIGMSVSVYEPQVVKKNGDAYENHPILSLYRNPNPRRTASDFIYLWAMYWEVYGESFWYLARGERTQRVKEIYQLDPSKIELQTHEGELVGYILNKGNGQRVPFLPEEIIHDKRPNLFNEWRGQSILEKAAVYIDTEINTANFTLNYISNSASPSGIVTLPNMGPDAFKEFTLKWREGYEGPENAGKTAFIRGEGVDFKAVGATLKDIDQEITRKMSEDDVLMMLEVPKPLLGRTGEKGLGRSDIDALYYIFSREKIEPMMVRLDRIYEMINDSNKSGQGERAVEITHDSPVPEDKEFEHKQSKDLVNVVLTVNEVRERMGLPPIEGGDELVPGNRPQQAVEVANASYKTKRIVLRQEPTQAEIQKNLSETQEKFRQDLVNTTEIYAKKLKKEISTFANGQRDKVISNINTTSKAFEEWLFSLKDESEDLTTILTPIVIELMDVQAEGVAHFITGELITVPIELRKQVEQNILQISGLFNEETYRALEKTLTEGQTAGESLVKLKKRVEAVYSDVKGYKAERIARSESARASNTMAEQVYKANGYNRVEWFVNPGACEFCQTFSGQSREIGGRYVGLGDVVTGAEGGQLRIEYSDIEVPPLHPNCSCSLVPVA